MDDRLPLPLAWRGLKILDESWRNELSWLKGGEAGLGWDASYKRHRQHMKRSGEGVRAPIVSPDFGEVGAAALSFLFALDRQGLRSWVRKQPDSNLSKFPRLLCRSTAALSLWRRWSGEGFAAATSLPFPFLPSMDCGEGDARGVQRLRGYAQRWWAGSG